MYDGRVNFNLPFFGKCTFCANINHNVKPATNKFLIFTKHEKFVMLDTYANMYCEQFSFEIKRTYI